jgi:PhzF family phenazine biosynthesis protein
MKTVRFKQVDVFTKVPFRGNPVAVVLDGQGFSSEEMQRIAGWTNLSETTFVLPPTTPKADYLLRIFTPRMELPFAGHPTIGSAHAVLEAGIAQAKGGRLRQECGAGILELEVDGETLWLDSPKATETPLAPSDLNSLSEILKTTLKPTPVIINVGPRWLVAEVGDAEVLGAITPDMAALAALSVRLEIGGVTAYGTASDGKSAIHVRSFAPAHAIPEDPVCGSGNISVAAYLKKAGRLGSGYVARQGMQLGRDGQVSIRYQGDKVLLGGSAVTCVEGTLRV